MNPIEVFAFVFVILVVIELVLIAIDEPRYTAADLARLRERAAYWRRIFEAPDRTVEAFRRVGDAFNDLAHAAARFSTIVQQIEIRREEDDDE